jgi:hypothetical protein
MMRILYHYTSQAGYEGIIKNNTIFPSLKANNPKDARFGEGQYLSDIIPNTKRPAQLSMIFFGIPWAGKRFAYHVNINTEGLTVLHGRQYVYVIQNTEPLDITNRLTGHGRNL